MDRSYASRLRRILGACALSVLTAPALAASLPAERRSEPVIVRGDQVRELAATSTREIAVFRFDTATGWHPVAHQVDERRMTGLWPGAICPEQCEERYVFDGDEGNGLDADDEIVFMASSLGDKASERPVHTPAGFEIEVSIPGKRIAGYVYVFAMPAAGKPAVPGAVSYSRTVLDPSREDTTITTDKYRIHFSRLWVLDDLASLPGAGGDGTDLLDQWKGRAYDRSLRGETEDVVGLCGGWSNPAPHWGRHTYLGHIAGPVRAIRGVQGACSWPNLTRYDIFYPDMAEMTVNLRGHGFPPGSNGLWMYWDYAKAALPLTYYNAAIRRGTAIDGNNDSAYPNGDHEPASKTGVWEQVVGPHGGFAFTLRQTKVIPGPMKLVFADDAAFHDGTGSDPSPSPGVLGGHGIHIVHIEDTDPQTGGRPAQAVLRYRPLAAGAGSMGDRYLKVDADPLDVKATRF
jgi:hypothetical protein